ncbi:MAG: amidohydrolase/deacetylase family metallohydrolase [Anaerolineae bacterium]|nr:amidohydrolase/deacetylase family metallohydrolase [Anaerolineae bacterium]
MNETGQYELLLHGGHVIDPANQVNAVMDVAIRSGQIARVAPQIDPALADKVVDVSGLYVTPGLIDIHVHVYHTREPEGLSVVADHHSFRSGVTTVVDTGTAGAKHFLHFKRTVIDQAKTRIFAFINIVKSGMLGDFEQDMAEMDPELAASIVLAYPETCVGIKTAHYWTYQPWDDTHIPWAAVDRALEASAICHKPLMVDFWPRPERTYQELLKKMQPGDIHTHVYAQQFPVLTEDKKPQDFYFEARERGIIFDVGHGAGSFWFRQALPATEGGFWPDSISTDLHIGNVNGPVFDMLTTMSKFLSMGMPLQEVIYRSTVTPAQEIGHPELGTLSEGAEADLAVLRLDEGQFCFMDCGRAKYIGRQRLDCRLTLRAGEVVFDAEGLSMPLWTEAPPDYWIIRAPGAIK